jgi:aspartate aminotransferase-like enzyme
MRERLMTPGPIEIEGSVLLEQALPMTTHRSPEFMQAFSIVIQGLRTILGLAGGELFLLPCSGTGAMEAAVVNLFSPGEAVLVVCNGYFGERFAAIAGTYGVQVEQLEVPWGCCVDPQDVRRCLEANHSIEGVLVVFHETSTGVVNDLEELGRVVTTAGALLVVDAVSGVAVSPIQMDAWGLDCVLGASQKGLGAPPGAAFIGLSERAWAACSHSTARRFYFNLQMFREALLAGVTPSPWTPAIATIRAMRRSIEKLLSEGMDRVYERQGRVARAMGTGLEAVGLELPVSRGCRSQAVTLVAAPPGISPHDIVCQARQEWGVTFAGALGKFKDSAFRVGHMGAIDVLDVVAALFAVEVVLHRLGQPVEPGASARAIQADLRDDPTPGHST